MIVMTARLTYRARSRSQIGNPFPDLCKRRYAVREGETQQTLQLQLKKIHRTTLIGSPSHVLFTSQSNFPIRDPDPARSYHEFQLRRPLFSSRGRL